MTRSEQATRRATPPLQLLHHGLVGALLGGPLVVWLSGALVYYAVDAADDMATYQVTMWVVPVLWTAVIGLAFLAPSRRICWAALLGGNLLAWLLFTAVRA